MQVSWPSFLSGVIMGVILAMTLSLQMRGSPTTHSGSSSSVATISAIPCTLTTTSIDALCASHASKSQLTIIESLPKAIQRSTTTSTANYNRTVNSFNQLRKSLRNGGKPITVVEEKSASPQTAAVTAVTAPSSGSGTCSGPVVIASTNVGGKCSHFECVDSVDTKCYGGAYDGLYKLLQVDIDAWTADGGISNQRVTQVRSSVGNYEGFFMHIHDHQFYLSRVIQEAKSRVASQAQLMYWALQPILHTLPDTEFFVDVTDATPHLFTLPAFAMNRANSEYRPPGPLRQFAIPDFTHFSWPEPSVNAYDYRVAKIREASKQSWDTRINKIYFRGAMSQMRQFIADAARAMPTETDLLESQWSDVRADTGTQPLPSTYVPLEGACKYKFLLHAKGVFGPYSSRLKYLLACGSVVMAPRDWHMAEYFYDLLVPDVNFIAYDPETFQKDLRRAMDMDPEKLKSIAKEGQKLAALLDRNGGGCFIRQTVRQFAAMTQQPVPPLPNDAVLLEDLFTVDLAAGMRLRRAGKLNQ